MSQQRDLPHPSSASVARAARVGVSRASLRALALVLGTLLVLTLLLGPTASPAAAVAAAPDPCRVDGQPGKSPHAAPGDDGDLQLDPAQEATERARLRQQAKLLPPPKHQPSRDKVALFGYVVATGPDCLVMDTYEPVKGGKGMKVLEKESLPGLGLTSTRLAVYPRPHAVIEARGGFAGLTPNTPILVGGALAGDRLQANVVADLRLAQPRGTKQANAADAPASFRRVAPAEGGVAAPVAFALADDPVLSALAVTQSGPTTLDFKGGFGGPTYEYVANPNVTIFDIGVVSVDFTEFRFIAALAGWSYDFPFAFSAEAPTLIAGQDGSISLNVQPQSPANGYSSFYGGLGVNVALDFNIWTAIGCGDVGLESCDFKRTVNLNAFSMINSTTGAPPMPGQTLDVPEDACPSFGISIPNTPISAADLGVCNDFTFHGAPFKANLSVTGGRIPGDADSIIPVSFDGTTPVSVNVRPSGGELKLKLDNFSYMPTLDYGLHFRVRVVYIEVWSSPTIPIDVSKDGEGTFPAISNPFPLPGSEFVTRDGPQPTAHSFAFRAIPVLGSLVATPNPSVYGQTVALAAGIPGAYDDEAVTFTEGATTLGTATTAGGRATFNIATLPAGTHTITATYTGSDGYGGTHTSSRSVVLTVQRAPLTITADNKAKQYSDPLPPFTVTYTGLVLGEGPGVLGGALVLTQPAGQFSAPGAYTIVPNGLTSSNYAITFVNGTLTVYQEDARTTYTGAALAWTTSPTSGTANVTLAATIRDITAVAGDPAHDPYPGDIRNATVTFIDRDTGATLCTGPIGLVAATDTKTGTATCTWAANIGNADSASFQIGIIVGGYYVRDDTGEDAIVTVAKPLPGSFITGGGHLVASASAGLYPGAPGNRTNFGFNVKYNKGGKSLQGHVTVIVRDNGRVYQIKGNVMTSLATDPTTGIATFNGKASIRDITDPLNPVAIDGNATLQITLTDRGEPGTGDTIGITLWNKSGGLWFSSNWDGTRTIEQTLGGGNLAIH